MIPERTRLNKGRPLGKRAGGRTRKRVRSRAGPVEDLRWDALRVVLTDAQRALALKGIDLPTRVRNFAESKTLTTLGDLALCSRADLMAVRSLGRVSMADLYDAVAAHLGLVEPVGDSRWDALRVVLTDAQRALPLADLGLSGRVRKFAECKGLTTLGDLAQCSKSDLLAVRSLGPVSVAELHDAVVGYFGLLEQDRQAACDGLLESFQAAIEKLAPVQRSIAIGRSGLGGAQLTLAELGVRLGVGRQRILQIEVSLCDQVRRQPWARRAFARVQSAVTMDIVPLDDLAADPWWGPACAQPSVVGFVVEHLLKTDVRMIAFGERLWLSRHNEGVVSEAWSSLLQHAKAIPLPTPLTTFEPLVAAATEGFGPRIALHFEARLRARLKVDRPTGHPPVERVVALRRYGQRHDHRVARA